MQTQEQIVADSWWTHNREGYSVQIEPLDLVSLRTKGADAANWEPAVAYIRPDGDGRGEFVYIRTVDDFLAKFTLDERLGDEE